VIEILAERTPAGRFARALLHNNVGSVELARGRRPEARAAFERALRESSGLGGGEAVELAAARSNLALASDDPGRRDQLLAEGERELTRLLGAEHPSTLQARTTRGMMIASQPESSTVQAAACNGYELHADLAREAARCWANVGFLRYELGDVAGAVAAMERASALAPPAGGSLTDVPIEAAAYAALWRGAAQRAVAGFVRAIDATPPLPGDPWWVALRHAELALGLGRARRAVGDAAGAAQALDRSVYALAAIARDHPSAHIEHRLARARAELALAVEPGDRARELAAAALQWMRATGSRSEDRQRLERLVSDH